MAIYLNSPDQSAPSTDNFLREFLGNKTVRDAAVRISTEQRNLLDSEVAWSHDVWRRQQRFNVPPQVLQDIKAFHSRELKRNSVPSKRQHVTVAAPADRDRDTSSSVTTPEHNDQPWFEPNRCAPAGGEHEDDGRVEIENEVEKEDEDETKTQASWSSSDEEHLHPPRARLPQTEQDEFLTQVPLRSSPPRPSDSLPAILPAIPASSKRPVRNDPPSSSFGPEDELELEVPAALEANIAPVNKVAQPVFPAVTATPPSAQVVPCTYEPLQFSPSPEREDSTKKQVKRSSYKKLKELYSPKAATATSLGQRMARMGPPKPVIANTQDSSSTSNASSSIIPATSLDPPKASLNPSPESSPNRPASSLGSPVSRQHTEPQFNMNTSENPKSTEPRQDSPVHVPPQSPKIASSPPSPVGAAAPGREPTPQPVKQPEAPFIEFTLRYPGYTGSLKDFVTACTYLKSLVGKRRLRPFLFDDFIRAWSEGYLPYVGDCDSSDPPSKALTAIEWFNQLDGAPIFTKQVMTTTELERVFEFYPAEVVTAREAPGIPRKKKPAEKIIIAETVARDNKSSTTGSQSSLKSSAPSIERGFQAGASTVAEVLDRQPPQASNPAPPLTADRAQPAPAPVPAPTSDKLMNEVSRRPNSIGLIRSLSEAAAATATATASPNKRKPSGEFPVPKPKKLSTGSGPHTRSPSGSSAHSDGSKVTMTTSSAVGGARRGSGTGAGVSKRRYADDPEKRLRQFGKFVRRRYQDSIASSAPANSNNTPTSGQKGQ